MLNTRRDRIVLRICSLSKKLKEINPEYSLEGLKMNLQYSGHLMWIVDSFEKTLMLGKIEGRRRRGVTEDEMVGWHHRFNGHEFEQTLGDSEGQGSLVHSGPWDCRVRHDWTTEHQQRRVCLLVLQRTKRWAPLEKVRVSHSTFLPWVWKKSISSSTWFYPSWTLAI